jgi:glycosyltransferase involved in cell wall biosynthesis
LYFDGKVFESIHPGEDSSFTVAIDVTSYLASRTGVGVSIEKLVQALTATPGEGRLKLCAVSVRKTASSILRNSFPDTSVCVRPFPLKCLVPLVDRTSWLTAGTIFGDADVFHAGPFLVPAGKKSAIVVTVNDLTPVLFPELHLASNLFTVRQLVRRLERADLVVVPSASTGRDLGRLGIVPQQKVRVIPYAADGFFRPVELKDLEMLSGFGLEGDYILNVGALEPRKNLPRLFEAFKLLKDRHHLPHKLVVAGPRGWNDQEVFRSVNRFKLSDSVVFAGYVSREILRLLYSHAALLVYPSLYEGFGLPPLEAMASGCPVAASNTGSLPEVVGEAGIYFNPLEIEDIAGAIHRILGSVELRAKLVQSGRLQSGKFSWEKTAEATRKVYGEARKLRRDAYGGASRARTRH